MWILFNMRTGKEIQFYEMSVIENSERNSKNVETLELSFGIKLLQASRILYLKNACKFCDKTKKTNESFVKLSLELSYCTEFSVIFHNHKIW